MLVCDNVGADLDQERPCATPSILRASVPPCEHNPIVALALAVLLSLPAAAEIVLPANPLEIERYAANELAYHLEQATGVRTTIVYEDEVPVEGNDRRYYVGATAAAKRAGLLASPFERDEHHVKGIGRDLYFLGGDRDGREIDLYWSAPAHGTMWAVYDYLEHEMGVRWLWPGKSGEVIPKRTDVPVAGVDRRAKEKLFNREFYCERHVPDAIGWADVANREKFDLDQRRFLLRHRNGNSRFTAAGHAFWVWWEQYGKSHPEYFMERLDGTRGPCSDAPNDVHNVSMCVSSPEFHRQIVHNWLRRTCKDVDGEHYETMINCMENDSPGMCLCARCRSWDPPDPRFDASPYWSRKLKTITRREYWEQLACVQWGESDGAPTASEPASVSDRYVKFYRAVLAEARRHEPTAEVIGYAYANYLEPPKETTVPEGVLIEYVPRMFFPYDKSCSDLFRKYWSGWNRMGAEKMIYRPNYMLAGANLPLNQARIIADDFGFAWKHGMQACYFDRQTGAWSVQAVMNYTVYRLMREPDLGYERALAEFCACFGAAAPVVRDYWALFETVGKDLPAHEYQKMCRENTTPRGGAGGGNQTFMLIAPDLFSEAFFDKARSILSRAEGLAADDAAVRGRLRYLAEGLRDAQLTYRTRCLQKKGDKAGFDAAFKALCAYRATVEAHDVCNYSYHCQNERNNVGWPHNWTSMKGARPDLVEKVLRGEIRQAMASWWGYDKDDATKCLQAAIDSKVPRLMVDTRNGPWTVSGLRGVSNQEICLLGEVVIRAREGAPAEKPLLDFSGLHDVRLAGWGTRVVCDAAPDRVRLSVAGAKRLRVGGIVFANCPAEKIESTGAKNYAFREVTRTVGKKTFDVR